MSKNDRFCICADPENCREPAPNRLCKASIPHITIRCPKCELSKVIRRIPNDPPGAVRVHIQCEECNRGDFDSEVYFDANGRVVTPDYAK